MNNLKPKKLTLNKTVIRNLTPDESQMVSGGVEAAPKAPGTGGWVCFTIQTIIASIQICPTSGCSPGDTTQGGETYTCAC